MFMHTLLGIKYVRVIRVDVVLELMARDRCELVDAGLSETELVDAFRQVERPNAISTSFMSEIL